MLTELERYYAKPEDTEKRYRDNAINRTWPEEPTPQCEPANPIRGLGQVAQESLGATLRSR